MRLLMSGHAPLVYILSSFPCWFARLRSCRVTQWENIKVSFLQKRNLIFSFSLLTVWTWLLEETTQSVDIHLPTLNDIIWYYVCLTHLGKTHSSVQCNWIKYICTFLLLVLFLFLLRIFQLFQCWIGLNLRVHTWPWKKEMEILVARFGQILNLPSRQFSWSSVDNVVNEWRRSQLLSLSEDGLWC